MKRISIIIPVHNVEKYLEKCLNSIISQINEQDEIILINDNSQDSSEQICKKFVEQYNNIKLENGIYGGPSKTRKHKLDANVQPGRKKAPGTSPGQERGNMIWQKRKSGQTAAIARRYTLAGMRPGRSVTRASTPNPPPS